MAIKKPKFKPKQTVVIRKDLLKINKNEDLFYIPPEMISMEGEIITLLKNNPQRYNGTLETFIYNFSGYKWKEEFLQEFSLKRLFGGD